VDIAGSVLELGVVLGGLERVLDWRMLGEAHCLDGGDEFFPPEQVRATWTAGLAHGSDLQVELEPGGASLYLGASVAELVPMLFETLVLRRAVTALDLDGPVTRELNRGLAETARLTRLILPTISIAPPDSLPEGAFDHGWCVSVFTDPQVFPALHDHLYGRLGDPELGAGSRAEDLDQDLSVATPLIESFLACLVPGALLTITDEERILLDPACRARGWRFEAHDRARLSAVVGDPVRHGRLVVELEN
jgi:hypothetical protein